MAKENNVNRAIGKKKERKRKSGDKVTNRREVEWKRQRGKMLHGAKSCVKDTLMCLLHLLADSARWVGVMRGRSSD